VAAPSDLNEFAHPFYDAAFDPLRYLLVCGGEMMRPGEFLLFAADEVIE
jgi:hypothetical protein